MSLTAAFQIGNSALTASQLAIQVAGNNLANAATPGYARQIAFLTPARTDMGGRISIGTGVNVLDVRRQVNEAIQARLYGGVSAEAAAAQQHHILSQIESVLGELGNHDLSSELSRFFNSWSERANLIQSSAVVVQQGERLADFIRRLRSDLMDQRAQIDRQLGVAVEQADGLLNQIADLNQAISEAEGTGGHANALRDQRDQLIVQLSQFMDVTAVEQPNGATDILIGSTPVVLGGRSRGVQLERRTENGELVVTVNVKDDGQPLNVRAGQIGALVSERTAAIDGVVGKLDALASQLIFEVNRLHSTGRNASGLISATATLSVPAPDRSLALNDPANVTLSALPFRATSGGFTIQVTDPTGNVQSVRIDIDLDGRTSGGTPGYGDDTSLDDIIAALNAVSGVSAQVNASGRLEITADPNFSFSFTDDTSGVLAVLGVNAYFTGKSAVDIGIRADLKTNPGLLSTGRLENGQFVENGTALAIAGLQDKALPALGGQSLRAHWTETVQRLGVATDAAAGRYQAAVVVRESLEAQRASVSGVSVDEESINLMMFQRQYQGAARFISIVDEMTQTLISLV